MQTSKPRLFLDSNVITDGLVSRFGQSKAILSLCASRTCRMILADVVNREVKKNIENLAVRFGRDSVSTLAADFERFVHLARPIVVLPADEVRVRKSRHLISHAADVPVILAAIDSNPDWLITKNRDHFTDAVAVRTGLRIASPAEFFTHLIVGFGGNQE